MSKLAGRIGLLCKDTLNTSLAMLRISGIYYKSSSQVHKQHLDDRESSARIPRRGPSPFQSHKSIDSI
jgi:hypothetical protein